MAGHADNEGLLRVLARLRDAQTRSPGDEDLRAVRAFLERQLGPTVKRALAARALGVSQPALERWIEAGDVATVPTPAGRWEVPAPALVELMRAVDEARTEGERFPLAAALNARRAAATELDLGRITRGLQRGGGHRGAELRALAYHRAVAQRLDAALVEEARQRLALWRGQAKIAPAYAERWEALLARPLPAIARAISRDDEAGHDLRQNSPFAGALTEPERRLVLAAVA